MKSSEYSSEEKKKKLRMKKNKLGLTELEAAKYDIDREIRRVKELSSHRPRRS